MEIADDDSSLTFEFEKLVNALPLVSKLETETRNSELTASIYSRRGLCDTFGATVRISVA